MGITRIGSRLNLTEQMARKPENRGRLLAVELCSPKENILRASEVMGKSLQEIQSRVLKVDGLRKIDLGIKMIKIPAGGFIFQEISDVFHNGFKIAETPLTNGQFSRLLGLKPEELAQIVSEPAKRLQESSEAVANPAETDEIENCPMVYIDQTEAAGIANLLGFRLPTELERERAAAGTDGREYPWGTEFDSSKAVFNTQGTMAVKVHSVPGPEGIYDLAGNVWEWTSSRQGDIDLSDIKNPVFPKDGNCRVLYGGSWCDDKPGRLRSSSRAYFRPECRVNVIGLRFAEDM